MCCELAPSLLSANFFNLKNDFDILIKNDIKYVHLDVMDGVFVTNISFGIPVIKSIKNNLKDSLIFDTHLMISDPIKYIEDFANAGADIITFHMEATNKIDETIDKIKSVNKKVGISINPNTEVNALDRVLDKVDLVLVMSVNPGFGGQKFIDDTLNKIIYLKKKKDDLGLDYIIEMDGGINSSNIKKISDMGCDLAVAGSAVFSGDIEKNIKSLRQCIFERSSYGE